MQILNKSLRVADNEQTAALGSIIYASICADDGYCSYEETVRHMAHVKDKGYELNKISVDKYNKLYKQYEEIILENDWS